MSCLLRMIVGLTRKPALLRPCIASPPFTLMPDRCARAPSRLNTHAHQLGMTQTRGKCFTGRCKEKLCPKPCKRPHCRPRRPIQEDDCDLPELKPCHPWRRRKRKRMHCKYKLDCPPGTRFQPQRKGNQKPCRPWETCPPWRAKHPDPCEDPWRGTRRGIKERRRRRKYRPKPRKPTNDRCGRKIGGFSEKPVGTEECS